MAKKYPFTRTISAQKVVCLVFDKDTAEASNTTVVISPPISDVVKLERAVERAVNKDNLKFIDIVDVTLDEQMYGITLEDFLAHSVRLDPKTRQPLATV